MALTWNENPRILLPALLISVALNLAVAGYFISHTLRAMEKTHDHVMHERMEGLVTLLPPESRESIRKELDAQSASIRTNMKLIRSERKHIQKIIRSENMDEKELEQAFQHMRELHSDTQRMFHEIFSRAVAKLSPEQRRSTSTAITARHPMSPSKAADTTP